MMTSKIDLADIGCNDSGYLFALKKYLNESAPQSITALGNPDILENNSTALFCSQKCPGDLILKTYDLAQIFRQAGMTRLLFLSPFKENQRRISVKTSHYRNLFVAALSVVVFVAHADPASKTETFCREILSWQKAIYTFDSDYNKNLIEMGAQLVSIDNVSEWANFLGSNGDR
jgi:predicted Rossmann fold nucleotide-binding protein DprA/Smf involved in DNA uptake